MLTHALSLLQSGDAAGARAALLSQPVSTAAHAFLQGACEHALGDIAAAQRAFAQALCLDARHAQAACALGSLLMGQGHIAQAEAVFRKHLALCDDAQLRFNLAVVLENTQRSDAALQEYSAILQAHPQHPAARHNRAGLHARHNRLAEAAEDYRALLNIQPQSPHLVPWHNLGEIELALGHYDEATRLLQHVVSAAPDNGKARTSLAVAAAANGDISTSQQHFDQLHQHAPSFWQEAQARLNHQYGNDTGIDPRLIFLLRQKEHLQTCHWLHWPRYTEVFRSVAASPSAGESVALAYAALASPLSATQQLALNRHIAHQFQTHAPAPFTHAPRSAPTRLRIGYAAPRYGHHVTGLLVRHLFAAHTAAVDVLVISLSPDDHSDNLRHIRHAAGTGWHDVSALSDSAAAAYIHALNLDILIDLAVFNDNTRPLIIAQRPAPIQVSWLGAAYSSGAPWMDYVLTDATVSPRAASIHAGNNHSNSAAASPTAWCSEAEVHLPSSYFVYSHDGTPPVVPARAALGLPSDAFVFACLNLPSKIDPDTFAVWMRVLGAAPHSVLWLLAHSPEQMLNLRREAEWRGVSPDRLIFAPRIAPADHVARMGAADLFLDTRFFNGHTTVAESLWAGTPVLSCAGDTFASRVGASLLTSCQLPELIAPSWAAYEQQALALYQDRAVLARLRQTLAQSRLCAAPFNMPIQARHLETAYQYMRARFAQGLPPARFSVPTSPVQSAQA